MSTENKNTDQADILAQLEQANADLATARQTIGTLQTQVTSLTSERDTARASLSTVTQERDTLRAENDRLKAEKEDFNKRLAAELVRHGIRFSGTDAKQETQPARKLTADERVALSKSGKAST